MGYPMSLSENIQDQVSTQDPSLTSETSNSLLHNSIIELIFNRRLRPGDALPNERELVEELGVGRNSVREAIKSLQALGVVSICSCDTYQSIAFDIQTDGTTSCLVWDAE